MNQVVLRIHFLAVIATVLIVIRRILEKLTGRSKVAPPRPGDDSVNVEWMRGVLEKNGYTQFKIKGLMIGDLNDNRGLAGQINKIRLEYDDEHTVAPYPPTHFVLKMTRSGFGGRVNSVFHGTGREAKFYASERYRSLAHLYPRVYYSHGSLWYGEMTILLEDVTVQASTPLNFVFGNQIWGVPKAVEPPRDVVATLETVWTLTAQQHARFWNDPTLLNEPWLKANDWYHGKGRQEWEIMLARSKAFWEAAKVKAADKATGWNFSKKLSDIIDMSFEKSSWEAMQKHINTHPFTLTHGDYHASNMFLVRKEGANVDTPIMFDWSEVGPWEPTADLGQMLISDVKPEFYKHTKQLVRKYHQTLIESGVSESTFPWDACWNSFCRAGVERWIFMFPILTIFPIPANGIQYFHDQILAFIEAHCPTTTHFELKPLFYYYF